MPEYGEKLFWDNRYGSENDPFDWLCDWNQLEATITPLITQTALNDDVTPKHVPRILCVGCGNAPFSAQMYYEGGFTNLINIDYSEVVIIQQKQKWPNLAWVFMDALDMDFADNEFDIIVDKSLIDTTMCYKSGKEATSLLFSELHRVLKPGGRLMMVSLHSEKEVTPFASSPGCNFAYTTCKLHNLKRKDELTKDPRILYHTFVVFDKLEGLELQDNCLILAQHPLIIVNSVADFVDDSLYDETAYTKVDESVLGATAEKYCNQDEKKLDSLKSDVDSLINTIDASIQDIEKLNNMSNISISND